MEKNNNNLKNLMKKNPRGVGKRQGYGLNENRNNTESGISALSNTQCELQALPREEISINNVIMEQLKRRDKDCYIVARLMSETGCRISEVLNMWGTDITKEGRVLIRAKKGGNNRVVNVSREFIREISRAGQSCELIQDKDRFYFYREFKKAGIVLELKGYKRARVTHAFRHEYANQIKNLSRDKDVTKVAMGHKSIKSQDYYVKSE